MRPTSGYVGFMAKSIHCEVVHGAAEPAGARSWNAASSAGEVVNWTLGPSSDRELGNACIGIAIGCALSLPIWIGLLVLYRLVT